MQWINIRNAEVKFISFRVIKIFSSVYHSSNRQIASLDRGYAVKISVFAFFALREQEILFSKRYSLARDLFTLFFLFYLFVGVYLQYLDQGAIT